MVSCSIRSARATGRCPASRSDSQKNSAGSWCFLLGHYKNKVHIDKQSGNMSASFHDVALQGDNVSCPYCAENISDAAVICRFCSRDLTFYTPIASRMSAVEKIVQEKFQ